MISNNSDSCLPSKPNSIDSKQLTFTQVSNEEGTLERFQSKVEDYCFEHAIAVNNIEQSEENHINSLPIKQRKKYKKRRWKGHSYGHKIIVYTGYLLQCYHFAFSLEGKPINPAKATLAKEIGICIRTLDKALKALGDMDWLTWTSGQKTWETNTYHIHEAYRGKPMKRPYGFKIPRAIYLKMQWMLKKKRFKALWNAIYEHILDDIADHIQRIKSFNTNFFKMNSRNNLKTSKDPPKKRKKPPNWHLLKQLNLSFKDQWILARYSEAVLRQAIDDLEFYQNEGHAINNIAAFLMNRCKDHQEKSQLLKKETRRDLKEWITGYFKSYGKRFNFISDKSTIDRQTSDSRPFIELKFHKSDIKKSRLHVYQRVCGQWIDKLFTFDRPDFVEAVELYLERSLREGF